MVGHKTLIDVLRFQAHAQPHRVAYTLTDIEGRPSKSIDYGDLFTSACRAATALKEQGLRRGDRVLVCIPTSLELVTILYGVLAAGGIVVPVYPPYASRTTRAWKARVSSAVRLVQPAGAVTAEENVLHMRSILAQQGPSLFTLSPSKLLAGQSSPDGPVDVEPDDLALIQLTSGTTAEPRGAAITEGNLIANISGIVEAMNLDENDTAISWLPPYHDMGLIGHIFTPLTCATHSVLMPTQSFREDPVRWLRLITEMRGTQTTAPNAAYEICARRLTTSERAGLDLSSLRWALDGAEQVHIGTIERFCNAFEGSGFNRKAFRPVYGLAEATLAATFGDRGGPVVDWIERDPFTDECRAKSAVGNTGDRIGFTSVGHPIGEQQLRIIDEQGEELGARRIGEVCLHGPVVMKGYFNDPVSTASVIESDGWLRTGDLGYLDEDGALYITGRRRELIIKYGRNFSPHHLESAAETVPGVRRGRVVACGVPNTSWGTEEIVMVAEARKPRRATDEELRRLVIEAVYETTGARPDSVVVAEPGALPKTTSGKLRRGAVRRVLLESGSLPAAKTPLVEAIAPETLRSLVELVEARVTRALGWL